MYVHELCIFHIQIKRMSSNSVGGERDSMVRNSSSRKNSLTQSPPRVERSSSVDKSEQRTPVPLRTKDAQLNVIVSPQVISNDNLTSVSTGPATSVSTTPSTDDAESTGDKKSIWKSALSRMGIRSSRSLSVSGGSTLARLQLSDDRVVVNPATDSAAPSPYNRDSNVSGLTDGTPFTAMSPNDSLAEPFSPGPVRRSVPVNIPVSKSNSKQNQPDFQTWNSEFKISGSDSDRDEIPMPSDSFIRKSMEVSVSSPHSIETDNAVKTNGISPVRVSTHSHLQSLSAKAPVTSVHSEINTDIDRGDVIRTSQVSQLKDDESVIKQARNRPKPSEPKMSKDEQFLTDNSTNNIVSVASNCSEEFTMADLYSTAAKTVERLNNGEKVDSSGPVNNSRFSLVLSDALKQKPAVIEKDNLELLHEQEKIAHHKRLGIHMVHTEHLLPLREPGPDYISSPQTTHPSGVSDYDQDAQSHISEKMSHYSQIGGVFRRSPSGRSIKGGAGRGAGLAYSHSAKKPGTTATTSDPNMSPVKPPRDGSEYKSPSPNSRDKLDFPFSPFTITKEDLAAMQAAEASECSPLSVTKQPQSQTQKQDASVTPRPDKPNRSRATSTDELFSPSQFLNPDESLHSLSQYAISPMTEEKRMYTQGTRIQLHDEQSPSGAVQRSDAEVQVEVEVTGSTEEVSKLRLMVQVLEAQAKVRCVERDEAEAEFDEKNQKLQAQLSQLESRNHDFEHLIELLRAEVTSVKGKF